MPISVLCASIPQLGKVRPDFKGLNVQLNACSQPADAKLFAQGFTLVFHRYEPAVCTMDAPTFPLPINRFSTIYPPGFQPVHPPTLTTPMISDDHAGGVVVGRAGDAAAGIRARCLFTTRRP